MAKIPRHEARQDITDRAAEAAHEYAMAWAATDRQTGFRKQQLAKEGFEEFMRKHDSRAFMNGYSHAARHAHGELQAENLELHNRLYDIEAEPRVIKLTIEALEEVLPKLSAGTDVYSRLKETLDMLKFNQTGQIPEDV